MITREALRGSIAPEMNKPVVLRGAGGPSILNELSNDLYHSLKPVEEKGQHAE